MIFSSGKVETKFTAKVASEMVAQQLVSFGIISALGILLVVLYYCKFKKDFTWKGKYAFDFIAFGAGFGLFCEAIILLVNAFDKYINNGTFFAALSGLGAILLGIGFPFMQSAIQGVEADLDRKALIDAIKSNIFGDLGSQQELQDKIIKEVAKSISDKVPAGKLTNAVANKVAKSMKH